MSDLIIIGAALVGSGLTLISGFGLGTLMLPVFALFFPVDLAVAMTATVHVLNNLFKFGLMAKSIDRKVVLLFGIPGIAGAFLGAYTLRMINDLQDVVLFVMALEPIKMGIGVLMIFFALTELFPALLQFSIRKRYLIPGGALSGFFGGLSGHQGALRSMFLIKLNLRKEVYIATGVAVALLVDFTRIPVYLTSFDAARLQGEWPTIALATLAAFAGAYLGKRMIPKVTLTAVHRLVGIFMIAMGVALFFNVI